MLEASAPVVLTEGRKSTQSRKNNLTLLVNSLPLGMIAFGTYVGIPVNPIANSASVYESALKKSPSPSCSK